jgi:hypothetical protein
MHKFRSFLILLVALAFSVHVGCWPMPHHVVSGAQEAVDFSCDDGGHHGDVDNGDCAAQCLRAVEESRELVSPDAAGSAFLAVHDAPSFGSFLPAVSTPSTSVSHNAYPLEIIAGLVMRC